MVALICCTEVLVVERVVSIRVLRRIPHLTTLRLGAATWQSLVAFLKGRKAAKALLLNLWAQSLMLASCAMVARFHHKVILAGTLTSVIVRVNEVTNIRVVTPLADVFIAFSLDDLTNLCVAKALTPELLNPLGKLVCIRFLERLGDATTSWILSTDFCLKCLRHLSNLSLIIIIPVLETLLSVMNLGCLSIRWHG